MQTVVFARTLTHFRRSVRGFRVLLRYDPYVSLCHLLSIYMSLFWTHTAHTQPEQYYMISSPLSLVTTAAWTSVWSSPHRFDPRCRSVGPGAARRLCCWAAASPAPRDGEAKRCTLTARQTLAGRPRHTTTVHQDEVPEDGRDWGLQ